MSAPLDLNSEILQASERIRDQVRRTPLDPSPWLSGLGGARVFVKLENLQHTGSFKLRGAMNKLICLSAAERARGVVTASTGNHGLAVARGLRELGLGGLVFVPENAMGTKIAAIERLGAEVRRFGTDSVETEAHARAFAARKGMAYIPPYNDPAVIAGQGTIAVELLEQLDRFDVLFASLGGGGLLSGIAVHLKSRLPRVRIIGCSPVNSMVMIQSIEAGRIVEAPSLPTLSDGTAGGLEPGSMTFDLCRDLVDEFVTVTEEEIAAGLRGFLEAHSMLIEGAAAAALAGYLKLRRRFEGRDVVIVACGANISPGTLKSVL